MTDIPDSERRTLHLLERIRAGDGEAREELFQVHRAQLSRALRPYFSSSSRGIVDSEELLQETLVTALQRFDQFHWRGQGAFLAWLKTIALNIMRNELRKLGGRAGSLHSPLRSTEASDSQRIELAQDQRGRTPLELAELADGELQLDDAIHALGEVDRNLIVHRQLLGQDYESLAAELEMSVPVARMRMSRAMSRLAQLVQAGERSHV